MGSPKSTGEPKRIAQWIHLKKDRVEEYKQCHAAVWPAVLEQIKDSNIVDYSIFFDASRSVLFASFKYVGTDWDADMAAMAANPKVQEWWSMTDGMQTSPVDGALGSYAASQGAPSWWGQTEEVFRFDG
ncbi:DUF718 domain protein [Atractiella rhizophila]|nr:DUF718 domain protein [Atractiella rhizophila]